jgi:phenylacetate-coenzyme A ligase PaaK-like adenylate-forming protein
MASSNPLNVDALLAPPDVLRLLAGTLGRRLGRYRAFFSSYERLDRETRAFIEAESGVPLFDIYGASEVGVVIAFECERGSLHVNDDYVVVEIVDELGRPVPPGEQGLILVTDLLNRAMPLIRYQLGDVAAQSEGSCPCGRVLSRISGIDGRALDTVATANGREIPARDVLDALVEVAGPELCLTEESVGRFTLAVPVVVETASAQACLERLLGPIRALQIDVVPERGLRGGLKRARLVSRVPHGVNRARSAGSQSA